MRTTILLLLTVIPIWTWAQQVPSIHEEQLIQFNSTGQQDASYYEAIATEELPQVTNKNCNLNKVVYGWHPYWVGSAYQNYQWDLLSHFSFFSYEVDPATGNPNSTHGWSTSAAVDAALASGNTKVTLCVTLFNSHTTFFGSATAQQTLIDNLINLIQTRGAHGVNIDFEGLPSSQTANFANFMVSLSNQMHTAIPGSEVSTVLYAVDWNNVFDFSIMEPAVDHYIIMGYGYYYTGSGTAGPTDPLYHFGSSYNYSLSRSITYYLDIGCPANKLVLGLPSYGYEWETTNTSIPSSTIANGTSRTYSAIMNNTSGNYSTANHQWEQDSYSDVYVFNSSGTKQCFISLDSAWQKRLDHVNKTGIAGIGIWALGYDNGYTGLWDAMRDYLTDCYEDPCSGTIHDFGGPYKNYYNDEDYTWTIQPPGASSLDIEFTQFDVELNYDYLYIFDGDSDQSPQIAGSPFTGTNSPGSFTTSTGAVTFRFYSDGATVTPGFLANYSCNSIPEPIGDFVLSSNVVCIGDSIQLINNSSDGDTYEWSTNSGGLSSSSAFEPYLYPLNSGNYTVELIVTNASGADTVSSSIFIDVYEEPVAIGAAVNNQLANTTDNAFFTNNSLNAQSYFWDFGDGSISTDWSPWHTYASSGVYTVMLVASNSGCGGDTTYMQVTVGSAGIEESIMNSVLLYPNPTEGNLYFDSEIELKGIKVMDAHGKIVIAKEDILENKIQTANLTQGMYFVHFDTEMGDVVLRFIKK